jgi:hypothetical protein
MPLLVSAALASRLGRWKPVIHERDVVALTAVSSAQWRELAAAFSEMPRDPGASAARARMNLNRFAARALRTGRWAPRLEGDPPSGDPTVYLTAHIGSLQALRYALRARGIPVASVIGPHNEDRPGPARVDEIFDRRHAMDFPHALLSSQPHRLRTALRSGSLILAADLPSGPAFESALLGGRIRIDLRPVRLARSAGVPCRAAFLTVPDRRWVLTLSPALPAEPRAACVEFARVFQQVASCAPLDLDGLVYASLSRGRP